MTDYMCVGLSAIYVCTQSCTVWDGTRVWQGKKYPPYLFLHAPQHRRTPHVYFSPNWILYYRSSQVWTSHFPLLSLFCLFSFSFLLLTFLIHFFFCISLCRLFFVLFFHSFLLPFLRFSFLFTQSLLEFDKDCIVSVINIKTHKCLNYLAVSMCYWSLWRWCINEI